MMSASHSRRLARFIVVTLGATLVVSCSDNPSTVTAVDGGGVADGGRVADGGVVIAVPVGAACAQNGDCGNSAVRDCLDEAGWGFPGGYCTRDCDIRAAGCGAGARCINFPEPGPRCMKICDSDADCRAGYGCVENPSLDPKGGLKVCAPGVRAARIGDPCTKSSECTASLTARCLTAKDDLFPSGYCTEECNPVGPNSCSAGAVCVRNANTNLGGVCLRTCVPGTDGGAACRAGYACADSLFVNPAPQSVCVPGGPVGAIGAPCENHGDCLPGSFCAPSRDGPRGGYCTRDCDSSVPNTCGEGGQCLVIPNGRRLCAKKCAGPADCRAGYACAQRFFNAPTSVNVCTPGTANAVPTGAPCADSGDCNFERQYCFGPNADFPSGYCTQGCNPQVSTSCPSGGQCFATSADDPTQGFCLATCASAGECSTLRGASAARYACSQTTIGQTPVPGGLGVCLAYRPGSKIGDACEGSGDCPLGRACIVQDLHSRTPWRGGYCADLCDARTTTTCGAGTVCVALNAANPADGACLDACDAASDPCRASDGYVCREVTAGRPMACTPTDS